MAKRRTRADQERIRKEVHEMNQKPRAERAPPSGIGFSGMDHGSEEGDTNVIRIRCPHCGNGNVFPGFSSVEVFICSHCGEPVEVEERKQ